MKISLKTRMDTPPLPPTFRQLCVIAREQLLTDPTIDDAEWAERIKQRLIALQFEDNLHAHEFTKAMAAVTRALEKQWGPRPTGIRPPRSMTPEPPQQHDPPW